MAEKYQEDRGGFVMDSNEIRDKMYQTIENLQKENVRLIGEREHYRDLWKKEIESRKEVESALCELDTECYRNKQIFKTVINDCKTINDVKKIVSIAPCFAHGGIVPEGKEGDIQARIPE